jgi:hypothetical protein
VILDQEKFVSLGKLSSHFDLPARYLKELLSKGLIPSLDVNGHRKFSPLAVGKALARLSATEKRRQTILSAGAGR